MEVKQIRRWISQGLRRASFMLGRSVNEGLIANREDMKGKKWVIVKEYFMARNPFPQNWGCLSLFEQRVLVAIMYERGMERWGALVNELGLWGLSHDAPGANVGGLIDGDECESRSHEKDSSLQNEDNGTIFLSGCQDPMRAKKFRRWLKEMEKQLLKFFFVFYFSTSRALLQ